MDEKKQTGFTLFPLPPTPPAKRSRARTVSSSASSSKSVRKGRGHGRKTSVTVANRQSQPGLIPAPLQIRRTEEEIPPIPTLLPALSPTAPPRLQKEIAEPCRTLGNEAPKLPAIRQASPMSLPRTPVRQMKPKPRLVAELVELEAPFRKRASSRLSQWLDLEDGEVDHRRLSKYLGSILDNTFEVPSFEPGPRMSLAMYRRLSKLGLEALAEQCECPPTAVICHCSSSPEFERFRSWSNHKPNSSVSSTACLVGVPRARFQSAFFNIPESPIAELQSPPGLTHDDEEDSSGGLDWAVPRTPSNDDVFGPSGRSYSSKYVVESPSSIDSSTPSRFQSFSRPFRPDSSYRCMQSDDSAPSTPSRSQSRSTAPKSGGFLTSISTVSSFDFDFDFKSRRQSLALHRLELASLAEQADDKEQSSHLRTESNESLNSRASQYELSTATASVALSSSSIKPVLITKTPKRAKMPSSTTRSQGSTSTSSSSKSSTSSVVIPEYWHRYNAGVQARSRSTTLGSDATDQSKAFSAMLTMPLLSPKGIEPTNVLVAELSAENEFVPRSPSVGISSQGISSVSGSIRESSTTDNPVYGNAFAQRSKTSATLPVKSRKDELSEFHFDTKSLVSDQSLSRSNTMPDPTTHVEESVNDHVQAHANASARLKAFMNGGLDPLSEPPTTRGRVGLGIQSVLPKRRSKKKQHRVDDSFVPRDDSGVFGRMSSVATALGAVPGRREFSEPQFYRCINTA